MLKVTEKLSFRNIFMHRWKCNQLVFAFTRLHAFVIYKMKNSNGSKNRFLINDLWISENIIWCNVFLWWTLLFALIYFHWFRLIYLMYILFLYFKLVNKYIGIWYRLDSELSTAQFFLLCIKLFCELQNFSWVPL